MFTNPIKKLRGILHNINDKIVLTYSCFIMLSFLKILNAS